MDATRLEVRTELSSWMLRGGDGHRRGRRLLIFEMVVAGLMGQSAFGPLRMIAAIALGEGALHMNWTAGLVAVVPVALAIHYTLSAVYGAIFGAVTAKIGALRSSRPALIGTAGAFGFLLWLVNFYAVAPLAFPWFSRAAPLVQFIAHTFCFGTTLGLFMGVRQKDDRR